jgi:hypothetical protein
VEEWKIEAQNDHFANRHFEQLFRYMPLGQLMSPILSRIPKILNAVSIFVAGGLVGFLGWQIYFAPFIFAAESSRLASDLKSVSRCSSGNPIFRPLCRFRAI